MSTEVKTWGQFKVEVERQLREQGCTDPDKATLEYIDVSLDDITSVNYVQASNEFSVLYDITVR